MQGQMLKDLPLDAISNIQSFLIGKPDDLRLKNNNKFVELQRLFKINYSECESKDLIGAINSSYKISGSMLNLNILLKQKERLGELSDDTFELLIRNKTFKDTVRPGDVYSKYIQICVKTKNHIYYAEDFDISDGATDEDVDEFLNESKMEIEYQMNEKQDNKIVYIHLSVWYEF